MSCLEKETSELKEAMEQQKGKNNVSRRGREEPVGQVLPSHLKTLCDHPGRMGYGSLLAPFPVVCAGSLQCVLSRSSASPFPHGPQLSHSRLPKHGATSGLGLQCLAWLRT